MADETKNDLWRNRRKSGDLKLGKSVRQKLLRRRFSVVGELQQHLQSIFFLLRSQDTITLAVRLENIYDQYVRYMVLVSTLGVDDTEETIILGVDLQNSNCTVGLVLPIWGDTGISMDGDGGFGVHTSARSYIFKPVSIQAMWSAIQCLNKSCQIARNRNYIPSGLNLTWAGYYTSLPPSSTKCVYEWNLLPDTYSHFEDHMSYHEVLFVEGGHYCPTERELTERYIWVKLKEIMTQVDLDSITGRYLRLRLEEEMGRNLMEYRSAIDKQAMSVLGQMDSATKILDFLYLGSEWNASNFEEMDKIGIRYVLNISIEIDNFFPHHFTYHNVRLLDNEQADLLRHWDETYRFLSKARETGTKALVHCKMGISRSAATVIAFVMKETGWPLDKSFKFVKEKRKIVQPNPAFMDQLHEYQGILDASKQRHNSLWRSKSESSLSTCESLENLSTPLEVFNSSEDLKDLNASLRRRSWSPDDSTANALLNYPDPSGISYAGEMYLRNPSPTSEGHLGDEERDYSSEDECSEIHIPVPSIPQGETTPTSPAQQTERGADTAEASTRADRTTRGCKSEGEEAANTISERTSLSLGEVRQEDETEISESENPLNTNNNSANNEDPSKKGGIDVTGATADGTGEEDEVTVPVDVKERISTIESQLSRLDSTGSPEKSRLESPLLEDLPIDTVRRRKEKLEKKIKGKHSEEEEEEEDCGEDETDAFTPEKDSGEGSDKIPATSEMVEEESIIPPAADETVETTEACQQKYISDIKGDLFQRRTQSPLEDPPPSQYSSPSLSKVEPGSVLKSKEKFQSWQTKGWKSPTFGEDSYIKFDGLKHLKPSSPEETDGGAAKDVLPETLQGASVSGVEGCEEQPSSTDVETTTATASGSQEPCGGIGEEKAVESASSSDTTQVVKDDEDGIGEEEEEGRVDAEAGTPDQNSIILRATGEEIPLQPGTVRRQTQGFEQLHIEGSEKANQVVNPEATGDVSEEMEVTTTEAAQGEEVESAESEAIEAPSRLGVEQVETEVVETELSPDKTRPAKDADAVDDKKEMTVSRGETTKQEGGDDGRGDVECTSKGAEADKEDGSSTQSGWKPGDVKKHREEFEKKSAVSATSLPGQKKSPSAASKASGGEEDTSLTSDQLQVIRDMGKMILCQDGSVEEVGEKVRDEEEDTKQKTSSKTEDAGTTQEENDYVNVLERIRKIELKRCVSIASMSSEKVRSKYRRRKDSSQAEQSSPGKDMGSTIETRGENDFPVSQKQSDNSLLSEKEIVEPAIGSDSEVDLTQVKSEAKLQREEKTEMILKSEESYTKQKVTTGIADTDATQTRSESKQECLQSTGDDDLWLRSGKESVTFKKVEKDLDPETISGRTESSPSQGIKFVQKADCPVRAKTTTGETTSWIKSDKEMTETRSETAIDGETVVQSGTTKRDENLKHRVQSAWGKGPLPNQGPRPREKKPYGPSHPLARLRKTSSGKHPFYSTM
ncbi:uncharacterized protein [Apostichopus japonicus]|uniref:uncharacterized protein isoform X5 n=1 Tax=Stichopus japonicus TaxID=307972 RepID=UPI003AB456C2